jgi:hypothetical protein
MSVILFRIGNDSMKYVRLGKSEFQINQKKIVPDDLQKKANELIHFSDNDNIDN